MEITATSSTVWYRAEARPGANAAAGNGAAGAAGSQPTAQATEEFQALEQLKARDREVRAHEQAHLAAAGGLVRGGMAFSYQRGPDGRLYAIGGEVNIDTSMVAGDPQATLLKAQQIQRAALAPAQPSGQDRAVAAQAAQMAIEARLELARQVQGDGGEAGSQIDVYA